MISQKHSLADYTQEEFTAVVNELLQANGTSAWQDRLLEHFIEMTEHPEGSDLIYYPATAAEGTAGKIIERIIDWRKDSGLPVFKHGS